MELDELKELVPEEQHADFDAMVDGLRSSAAAERLQNLTGEDFQALLESNKTVKSTFDATVHKGVSSSVETWRNNELPKLKEEWHAEAFPEDTEMGKRLKALEIKAADAERKATQAELKSRTLNTMADKKIDVKYLDLCLGTTEEACDSRTALVADMISTAFQSGRNEFLKDNGRNPQSTDKDDQGGDYYTEAQLLAMSPEEQARNWPKVQQSLSRIGLQQ